MTQSRRLGSRVRRRWLPLVMALTMLALATAPVLAQVTSKDISDLQKRAKEEGWTFKVKWTPACNYTLQELCGFNPDLAPDDDAEVMDPLVLDAKDLPSRFDWRDSTTLPICKDQAGCGSCWAFATVGPLECLIKLKLGQTVDLSEQWLVSCNPYGYNCEQGGFTVPQMFRNVNDPCGDNGAVLEADLPYIQANGTCNCPYDHYYWIESYGSVSNTVASLKQAIYEYGPISVSVYADDYVWPTYGGGVFNACAGNPTNHAVTLVGWDDNQGTSGVWFLRNSWGHLWGEGGGYMRIPYGCSSVGSNAKRIYYQPLIVHATPTLGSMPLSVTFTAETPGDSIVQCGWTFGDGDWAYGDTVTHEYHETGMFDVDVELTTPHGNLTQSHDEMVIVHADTARVPTVPAEGGTTVKVDVYLRNALSLDQITLPFTWAGPADISHDSISVIGCRTSSFQKTYLNFSSYLHRATIRLTCPSGQPWLSAGAGPVVSLYFTVPDGAPEGANPVEVVTYSSYTPTLRCQAGTYAPVLMPGSVMIEGGCCVGLRGNVDGVGDDAPTLGDLSALIDALFISLQTPECPAEANVDAVGPDDPSGVTLGDLSALIDVLFISLDPPPPCP